MNANEIVDLLRACSKGGLCSVCPLDKGELDISCIDELMIAAIDLIESLQAQLAESQCREKAAVGDLQRLMKELGGQCCTLCTKNNSNCGFSVVFPCSSCKPQYRGLQEAEKGAEKGGTT